MFFTKIGVLNWYSSMKIFFRKVWTFFDIEKWHWKSDFCNFASLSSLSEKVQKNFQGNFCDSPSISFIVISFYQILLTWWNAYQGPSINYVDSRGRRFKICQFYLVKRQLRGEGAGVRGSKIADFETT